MVGWALVLATSIGQVPGSVTVEDELRRARNEYAYGNYDEARALLWGLLYPMRLYSDNQVTEARKYLGLTLYLLGQDTEARDEFSKLLYLSPDYELDPFTIAPPIIELFESIRKDLKPELDPIRERLLLKKLKEPQKGFKRTIKHTVVEKSDLATLMPFGVGQFQNGDYTWGAVFAVSEVLLLALNIGAYLWGRSLRNETRLDGRRGFDPTDRDLAQALTITQFSSIALFGAVWSFGVFHARLNFVPTETSSQITDEPLAPATPNGGIRANLEMRF